MQRSLVQRKERKMSTSITTTKSTEGLREDKTNRYQSLVQKKASLEKRLNEKYEQLHQLCQKVSSRALHPSRNSFDDDFINFLLFIC